MNFNVFDNYDMHILRLTNQNPDKIKGKKNLSFRYNSIMILVQIKDLPPSWNIMISFGLLKRVKGDLSGPLLMRQFMLMIQELPSTFMSVTRVLKEMNVEILLHLSLKSPFTTTISIYYMIYQRNTCIYT